MLLIGWTPPSDADGAKVTVHLQGLDGKPIGGRLRFVRYGDNTPLTAPAAGEIIVVHATDAKGQTGSAVVVVPKKGTASVVVSTGKQEQSYALHAERARQASAAGDLQTYNAEAFQAAEAIDQEREQLARERQALEQWKQEQYLPDLTAEEAGALIEKSKGLGFTGSSPSVQLLTRYKSYLTRLEDLEETVKRHEDDFKTLQPPAKRTSMGPATCPNGEGGLLAGWLNDLTGSDLAAACDIDATRDKNKDRGGRQGERDHHEHD
jgi:hypothetical protein